MKVVTYRIQYEYGQTYTLKPIFDIHKGSKAHDRKAFLNFLKDSDERTFFIGGGDWWDAIVVPDKRYQKSSDGTNGDDILDQQLDEMETDIDCIGDRLIGIGIGNHELVALKRYGTNLSKRLCRRLNKKGHDVKYLGYSGIIRLLFRQKNGRGRTVLVHYHHGWGGGSRTEGGALTKYSKDVLHYDCDVGCYGHDHKKLTHEIARLGLVGEKLINKPIHIALCGSFKKTFLKTDDPTWEETKGFPPSAIGGVKFEITPTTDWMKIKGYTD